MLSKRWLCLLLLVVSPVAQAAILSATDTHLIWDKAPYNSFGDLIWFHSRWLCVFRESIHHVARPGEAADGKIRVISSKDGKSWSSSALIEEAGTDLRDPHISIAADGRLMIVAGGSKYPNGVYHGRQPRVMFSKDGAQWTAPIPVLGEGEWLWRVTWHNGRAYGISKYGSPSKETPDNPRRENLVTSKDGVHWDVVTELKVPGGDEATVRFLSDNRMVILMRCEILASQRGQSQPEHPAQIGVSAPPYTTWQWKKTRHIIGGPNFIVLPDDRMIAGGRFFESDDPTSAKTAVGFMSLDSYEPQLILPSNGDSSYPGFAYKDGVLWTVYYSSPEPEKTAMYMTKIVVPPADANGGQEPSPGK